MSNYVTKFSSYPFPLFCDTKWKKKPNQTKTTRKPPQQNPTRQRHLGHYSVCLYSDLWSISEGTCSLKARFRWVKSVIRSVIPWHGVQSLSNRCICNSHLILKITPEWFLTKWVYMNLFSDTEYSSWSLSGVFLKIKFSKANSSRYFCLAPVIASQEAVVCLYAGLLWVACRYPFRSSEPHIFGI